MRKCIPTISKNIQSKTNYTSLLALLLKESSAPRVLVIGGRILGDGMETIAQCASVDLVETDVFIDQRTMLVCDAHDIPFADGSFDCVIMQAVLEHVVDPYTCADEVFRVLNTRGVVYAETPFMQQVHGGCYDFTRFTHLGHRRLFRRFEEIDSGAACGPGMALAWAYQYFLLSFATARVHRALLRTFAAFTSFHLKYFDSYLVSKPGALDAASGCYFLGRKSEQTLPDRELIKLYRGLG